MKLKSVESDRSEVSNEREMFRQWLRRIAALAFMFAACLSLVATADGQQFEKLTIEKPRVIVLTDITNEPDDQESLARFLVYSNEYDVEGLIATTSTWLRDRVRKQNIVDSIHAYGKVRDTLLVHADGFPSADHLLDVTKESVAKFGMTGVGPEHDSSGSQHIIEMVDRDDPRPVWISVWGGPNCLAQALWRIREDRSEQELARFVSKLRVYAITEQDDSGPWMRLNFPDLFYVVSPTGAKANEYYQDTWTGISGDRFYRNGPGYRFDLLENEWLTENIRTGHGPLGELYPPWEYIMEGDTPSFLHLIDNGLGSSHSPGFGGWGGRYVRKPTYAGPGEIWTDTRDEVTTPDGVVHLSAPASVWRWRAAFQYDFAARLDWCVATTKEGANHPPLVVIAGDETTDVLRLKVAPGDDVELLADQTTDPDGDALQFHWFHYFEVGTPMARARDVWKLDLGKTDQSALRFKMPDQFPRGRSEAHLILAVTDTGSPPLTRYRRVILELQR